MAYLVQNIQQYRYVEDERDPSEHEQEDTHKDAQHKELRPNPRVVTHMLDLFLGNLGFIVSLGVGDDVQLGGGSQPAFVVHERGVNVAQRECFGVRVNVWRFRV